MFKEKINTSGSTVHFTLKSFHTIYILLSGDYLYIAPQHENSLFSVLATLLYMKKCSKQYYNRSFLTSGLLRQTFKGLPTPMQVKHLSKDNMRYSLEIAICLILHFSQI